MAAAPLAGHDATRMSLQGLGDRVALVTGAGRGIGLRVAQTLLALGASVAACDLQAPAVDGALGLAMDVTDRGAVGAAVERTRSELGPISVLVTAAGVFEPCALDELSTSQRQHTLDVNLTGTFDCVRRTVPEMCEQGWGRVVTLSSMAGIDGGSRACAHYAPSKGALIAFTKAISEEHCHRGVTANVVAPRAIRTPMVAGLEDELTASIPVGRLGEVDDVAALVAFLCSAHASYVTGEVFVLNGGWW